MYLLFSGTGPKLFNPRQPLLRVGAFACQAIALVSVSQLAPKFQLPVDFQHEDGNTPKDPKLKGNQRNEK